MTIPTKRALRVHLDRKVYRPGDVVGGTLDVDWPKSRAVRGIRLLLQGAEETDFTHEYGYPNYLHKRSCSERNMIIGKEIILFGGKAVSNLSVVGEALKRLIRQPNYPVLKAGRHRYTFNFKLPSYAPPSYEGISAKVAYSVTGRVDVPFGRDLTFHNTVTVNNIDNTRIAPFRGRGDRFYQGLSKVFYADLGLDLKLNGCRLQRGEHLKGRLLVKNLSRRRIRGARISLVGIEHAKAEGYSSDVTFEVAHGRLPTVDPTARVQDVRFGIEILRCPPPYSGKISRVELKFVVKLDIALSSDATIHIPLKII